MSLCIGSERKRPRTGCCIVAVWEELAREKSAKNMDKEDSERPLASPFQVILGCSVLTDDCSIMKI